MTKSGWFDALLTKVQILTIEKYKTRYSFKTDSLLSFMN